jgi:hypothetical protein
MIVRRLAAHLASIVGALRDARRFRIVARRYASRVSASSLLVDVRVFDIGRTTRAKREGKERHCT